jgi:hypothetical protein
MLTADVCAYRSYVQFQSVADTVKEALDKIASRLAFGKEVRMLSFHTATLMLRSHITLHTTMQPLGMRQRGADAQLSYYYTDIYVSSSYMCPHTPVYVFSYYYMCVLILLYLQYFACPQYFRMNIYIYIYM